MESLLDLWGRVWDAAWQLDDERGNRAATTYCAQELKRLGSEMSSAPKVRRLAEKLEAKLASEDGR